MRTGQDLDPSVRSFAACLPAFGAAQHAGVPPEKRWHTVHTSFGNASTGGHSAGDMPLA
ncbi:hypothetical protein ACF082_37300 [Streptomyces lydicus]|uniref:hypothetical protein n=1 Tax=Streptomyces lydicus TaxID=47763 RepID=UPI002E2FE07A|nr:hypothetical protein [Streptomyces lydicus]